MTQSQHTKARSHPRTQLQLAKNNDLNTPAKTLSINANAEIKSRPTITTHKKANKSQNGTISID